jgi:hypothetical protein
LIANIEPDKSDIQEYESIFIKTLRNHESVYTTN